MHNPLCACVHHVSSENLSPWPIFPNGLVNVAIRSTSDFSTLEIKLVFDLVSFVNKTEFKFIIHCKSCRSCNCLSTISQQINHVENEVHFQQRHSSRLLSGKDYLLIKREIINILRNNRKWHTHYFVYKHEEWKFVSFYVVMFVISATSFSALVSR